MNKQVWRGKLVNYTILDWALPDFKIHAVIVYHSYSPLFDIFRGDLVVKIKIISEGLNSHIYYSSETFKN